MRFIPEKTYIPASGKVFDHREIDNAIKAARDGWWTEGEFAKQFKKAFSLYLGVRYVSLVNSGSSANLLALTALTSSIFGKKALRPGDEVITAACAFPTTVNPIIQNRLKPVFVDIDLGTRNATVGAIKKAITKKTRAIMMAHSLGNPLPLSGISELVKKYDLWFIEDCCDALGSTYNNKMVSTFGHVATFSFYPAHQMSCSHNTPIPYLDESGKWWLEKIERIYNKYVNQPSKIKILAFDKNCKVSWVPPSSITRHKLGHSKKMLRIKTQHGREVEVTEDHSVFTIDQETAEIISKEAKEITTGDYIVATNCIPDNFSITYVDILESFKDKDAYVVNFSVKNLTSVKNRDYAWQYKSRNALPIKYLHYYNPNKENLLVGISQSNKIPARIFISEELCRFLGYFLAEGSYQNGLIFSFNKSEKDLIEDVIHISKYLFNLSPSIAKMPGNAVNIEIQSKNLEIVFKEVFEIKKGAKNKRIPWFMYHVDKKHIKSFIYGYTRGDGSIRILKDNTNRIDVTSVSKDLLNDFQYLLSKIQISASFYRRNKSNKNKKINKVNTSNNENYTLCFSGYQYKNKTIVKKNIKDRNNFEDQIPLLPIFRNYISVNKKQKVISRKRLLKYLESNSKLYSLVNGNLSFFKIRSIEKIFYDKNEYVYDFSVPGKENFYGGFLGVFLHNTMGEGGAVVTNNPLIHKAVRQFRDWGRDCWCDTGKDNTCKKRFDWKLGELPKGYDHKYIYSQIGYNLKLTDFQAAIGVAQLQKLPGFIKKRKRNFNALYDFFKEYEKYFILPVWEPASDPCWFGFMVVVKKDAPFSRLEIVQYLEDHGIGTRNLFAGNLLKHPAYLKRNDYRISGTLTNSDIIMNNGFWIGVYPGITAQMIRYMEKTFESFFRWRLRVRIMET
jgi:dTDP-4-amino-4,6-dideoxygalactose transaminase/intein/homing endonuclease